MGVRGLSLTELHIHCAAARGSTILRIAALRIAPPSIAITTTTISVFEFLVMRQD